MSEWKKVKLGDFISLQRGYDLTKDQFVSGPYPVVCSTSIMGYHKSYKVEAPGVVIGRSGTLGEVQYVTKNFWPHNTSLYVKDFKGNVPLFVFYFLKFFGTDNAGGGAAVPTLNRNHLYIHEIIIPSLSIQQRIATILSRYDSLIENYQKQIKLLEEAAQRLYKEWFVDLRFPGHENAKIVDGMPEGWEKKALSEVSTLKAGGDKPDTVSEDITSDCNIPIYSNGTSNEGLYGYTKVAVITEQSVTISARGSVGYTVLRRKPYVPIVRLISVIPSNVYVGYLYFFLKNTTLNSNGAAQQQITIPMIKNKEITIPCDSIINLFKKKVEPLFAQTDMLKEQIRLLTEGRGRLLPKLMSGEINVNR